MNFNKKLAMISNVNGKLELHDSYLESERGTTIVTMFAISMLPVVLIMVSVAFPNFMTADHLLGWIVGIYVFYVFCFANQYEKNNKMIKAESEFNSQITKMQFKGYFVWVENGSLEDHMIINYPDQKTLNKIERLTRYI